MGIRGYQTSANPKCVPVVTQDTGIVKNHLSEVRNPKQMTPLQFAKAQCANYTSNGGCSGIGIKDDGSAYMFGAKARCVLATNERCRYFEECVLPMGLETSTLAGVAQAKERDQAVQLYSRIAPESAKGGRICPECRERPLEKGHRFCYVCASKRRKEANRARSGV